MKNQIISANNEQSYLQNKARIYMLRCLTQTDCFTRFMQRSSSCSEVAEFLGFYHICDSDKSFDKSDNKDKLKSAILKSCQNALDLLEKREKQGKIGKYKIFSDNLALLKQILHLSDTDLALLEASMVVAEIGIFDEFLDDAFQNRTSHRDILLTIAKMIDCNYNAVAFALNPNSILKKMSILNTRFGRSIKDTLTFYDDDFANALLVEHNDSNTLMSHFVIPCEKSALSLDDYAHIKELDSLICYLKFAKDSRKMGVNILLYGTPGTGKTEFSKILAQKIGANLFKVRVKDGDDVEDGIKRVGSYLLAQRFLDSSKDILLYDEAEDVLNCEKGRFENKAFFNETLESNPVPTIWITNNVHSIDSAVVRRFDFAIAMNTPKKGVRKVMLEKICGEKLNKKTRKLIQKSPNLAPALINRANEISSVISGDFSKNFLMLLNNTLKAQGYCEIKKDKSKKSKDLANALPKSYSTDFINADCDISRVASGLMDNPNARICLYGLSGTGKSAFAKFVAKSLKRPCIIKAVSDLESMWVGETEKNIARAFKEAKNKKAVLVFDEVDSFLRDRRLAMRGYEATQVNEMLLQMEKFNGIFIATTNLMDNIDRAALRRFDLKVEFKALNQTQRVKLFKKECALLGLKCEASAKGRIERLELLTPGDFAAVKRQNKFSPIKDSMDFYARLCEEVKVKDLRELGANMGVGFLR